MLAFRDGDQLELDLFPGVPWNGHSPRGLTKGRMVLYSKRERQGHEVDVDPMQLSLWAVSVRPPRDKRPRQAAGAPLLLPLKKGRRYGGCFAKRDTFVGDYDGA